jgi:thiol-disulfide isomerase/thioredoxin
VASQLTFVMNAWAVAAILPWIVVAAGCWLGFQLVRQNGRILLRVESLHEAIAALRAPAPRPATPSGIKVGTVAPDFELPKLVGEGRKKLKDWRGKRVLIIFFNPGCGFCRQMVPKLSELAPVDGLVPVIVTAGDKHANEQLLTNHNVQLPTLLQKDNEVAASYQTAGTPTGYLIDEHGKIASDLIIGAEALLKWSVAALPSNAASTKAIARSPSRGSSGTV